MAKGVETQEFISLLIEHQEIIRSYIITQIPGSPDVRDILQEANIVLWEKRRSFRKDTNFGAWACTVARYKVLEHRRREARRQGVLIFNDELSALLASETEERDSDLLENRRKALEDCMSKLSLKNRRLLEARYVSTRGELSKFADESGRSRESLRVTLNRLRTSLRVCVRKILALEGDPT